MYNTYHYSLFRVYFRLRQMNRGFQIERQIASYNNRRYNLKVTLTPAASTYKNILLQEIIFMQHKL